MKSQLRQQTMDGETFDCLMFVCPGCAAGGPEGHEGLHILAVNSPQHNPSWDFDGNFDAPTLNPSILTEGNADGTYPRCHSFLKEGIFEFLDDCTHPLKGQKVPIPDLPDWAIRSDSEEENLED